MGEEQLVTFTLGQEEFGVDIMKVQEIIRIAPMTRVPKAPPYIEGVINLRGNVLPVIDLRVRFGMNAAGNTDASRIIIMNVHNKVFGIKVDVVTEVLRLSSDKIEPPPLMSLVIDKEYVRGVGKIGERLLILLELENVMGGEMSHEYSA